LSRKNYWNPCGAYPPPGDLPQCTIHHSVVFVYDDSDVPYSRGMLTKIYIDPAGAEPKEDYILEYDVMQRPTITKKKIGVEQLNEVTIQKSYDSAGRVVSITYPGNHVYSYEYDVAGNLKNLKDNTGASVVEYSGFTALGQPGLATFSNGVGTDYDYYSETGRLKTLQTNGPGYEFYQNSEYWYDGNGNITIIQEKNDNGSTRILHGYGYDALDRLGTAAGSGADVYSRIYLYDKIGNITSKSDVGTYRYDPYGTRPHAVKSVLANGPIYEQVPEINIVYDYDQKPTLVQKKNGPDWFDYVRFTYDGNGQRVKKENLQTTPNQVALYFGDLYEKRIGEQTFKIMHLFAGNRRVASIWLDNVTENVLFQQFYHPDHLGSTNVVTDENGDKKERDEYFPFGTYRLVEDDDEDFPNVFHTYTGQEEDDELGLFNYKARLYDPLLGRFISPDPIDPDPEDPQTGNRYAYARNNPLLYVDPTGHQYETYDPDMWDDWYIPETNIRYGDTESLYGSGRSAYSFSSPVSTYIPPKGTVELFRESTPPPRYVASNPSNQINLSRPDYISLTVNANPLLPYVGTLFGWSGNITLDIRYWNLYLGVLGANAAEGASGVSGSLMAGWLEGVKGIPEEGQLRDLLSGHGINLLYGYGYAQALQYAPSSGLAATEWGVATPQIGVSYHYSHEIGKLRRKQ